MTRLPLRVSLVAAAALIGLASTSAFAMDPQKVPVGSLPPSMQDSTTPDGLFDKSVPDSWDNSTKLTNKTTTTNNSFGGFHFSVSGSNTYTQPSSNDYGNANVPLSEFHQTAPAVTPDPIFIR